MSCELTSSALYVSTSVYVPVFLFHFFIFTPYSRFCVSWGPFQNCKVLQFSGRGVLKIGQSTDTYVSYDCTRDILLTLERQQNKLFGSSPLLFYYRAMQVRRKTFVM